MTYFLTTCLGLESGQKISINNRSTKVNQYESHPVNTRLKLLYLKKEDIR